MAKQDELWLKLGYWEGMLTDSVFLGAIIQALFSDSCPFELILESCVPSFQDKCSGGTYLKPCKGEITLLIIRQKSRPETFHFRKLPLPLNFSLTQVGNHDFWGRRFPQKNWPFPKGVLPTLCLCQYGRYLWTTDDWGGLVLCAFATAWECKRGL